MKRLLQEPHQAENLYRLILDNALDAFVAIDRDGFVLEWSAQAERQFGWRREEVLGHPLTESIIPERFHAAHAAGLRRVQQHEGGRVLSRHLETFARHKDGREIPVELFITPIVTPSFTAFIASLHGIAERKALEEAIFHQANITRSILDNMGDAVVVADITERLILANPAAQRMLGLKPLEDHHPQTFRAFGLTDSDGENNRTAERQPLACALRGEAVDGIVGMIRPAARSRDDGIWVSVNARPLHDARGVLVGAVAVYHDITELRRRVREVAEQAHRLQEQASLLDLSLDAIFVRTNDDVITYWNRSAATHYGYAADEAIGQVSHVLLKTSFPVSPEDIHRALQEQGRWEGQLQHEAKDGRRVVVHSQWALETINGQPCRILETNNDVTRLVETELALQRSQDDFRMLVEASTDYAIMMVDPQGAIQSWNTGAQRIFGLTPQQAIGLSITTLFTPEDQVLGEPLREFETAKEHGRSEDDRWHLRADGTRFWAAGVVAPLNTPAGELRGYVKILRDQTRQRLAQEQTQFLANHDALTGLPNRVQFSNHLHTAIASAERSNVPFALLLLDLDRFKHVNDTYGHHAGDLLLKEVALRIMSSLRETDFVARLGGDEFVIIQRDVSQPEAAEGLARKLVLELGRPYRLESHEVMSGTSIGIGIYGRDARTSVELLKCADLALYRAKSNGRHTYHFHTAELSSAQSWRRNREAALRDALDQHRFELYYQPQVDLHNWRISTVEALLRWNASDLELLLPGDFLDIAEDTGIIVQIGEWALREACSRVRRWQEQGMDGLRLSLNCSAREFGDPAFVARISSILAEAGVDFASLEVEIQEAMLAQHPEIREQLAALRALGIRLVIDHFGMGATALVDFKDLGVDALKIDKAFVQHLPHRREDSAITSAIISLAHNLGIAVVAGGVETAEQLAYLKARDCTSAQGFIFCPPLPADKFEELLQSGAWSRINAGLDDFHPPPIKWH